MAGRDPGLLRELLNLTLGDDPDIARKASWALRHCHEGKLVDFKPHVPKLIRYLRGQHIHHAVKRNILGILKNVRIPEPYKGELLDQCFGYIESGKETVAAKAFSIDIITNIAADEPSIMQELRLVLEDQLPYGTSGLISKASKILKRSKKNEHDY